VLRHRIDGRRKHDTRPGTVNGRDRGGVSHGGGLGLAAVRRGPAPTTGPAVTVSHDGACRSLRSSLSHGRTWSFPWRASPLGTAMIPAGF
jgi:hypothetical protein